MAAARSQCEVDQSGKWVLARKVPTSPQPPTDACTKVGPPKRLVPKMATTMNVRPRSSTRLRAAVLDKNGCVNPTRINWRTTHGRIKGGRLVLGQLDPGTVVTVTGNVGKAKLKMTFNVSDTRNLNGLAPVHVGYSGAAPGQGDDSNRERVRVAMTVDAGTASGPSGDGVYSAWHFSAVLMGTLCVWYAGRLRSRRQEE